MEIKLCPFMTLPAGGNLGFYDCNKEQCQLWTGGKDGNCSFKVIAVSLKQIATKGVKEC